MEYMYYKDDFTEATKHLLHKFAKAIKANKANLEDEQKWSMQINLIRLKFSIMLFLFYL